MTERINREIEMEHFFNSRSRKRSFEPRSKGKIPLSTRKRHMKLSTFHPSAASITSLLPTLSEVPNVSENDKEQCTVTAHPANGIGGDMEILSTGEEEEILSEVGEEDILSEVREEEVVHNSEEEILNSEDWEEEVVNSEGEIFGTEGDENTWNSEEEQDREDEMHGSEADQDREVEDINDVEEDREVGIQNGVEDNRDRAHNDDMNMGDNQNIPGRAGNEEQGMPNIEVNNIQSRLQRRSDDPHFMENIAAATQISRNDLLYMLLGMAKQNKFTNKAMNDSVKLVNSIFTESVLPPTPYLLDQLLTTGCGVTFHFYCKDCFNSFGVLDYKAIKTMVCDGCGKENQISDLRVAHFFAMFDLRAQIEALLGNEKVRQSLLSLAEALEKFQEGKLSDIYDGSNYKEFANAFLNSAARVISMQFCTDGTPLFKSSKCSIWPITLCINELLPSVRMKNILLGGLWFGKKQPPMDLFLEPFADHLIELSHGFHVNVNNEVWLMEAYVTGCCVDSGARGKVQGLKTHGGYHSCNWCTIRGIWFPNSGVKYPLNEEDIVDRTHDSVTTLQGQLLPGAHGMPDDISDDDGNTSDESNGPEGVIAISPLINVPQFNMVTSFFVEPLHLLHLGISKSFLSKWLTQPGFDYYIKDFKVLINARIESLRPPIEFRRFPRTLEEMARWKAKEWENWLLFCLVPVLTGILPDKYIKLWLIFAQAVYLLSKEVVDNRYVNAADTLLKYFLAKTQEYYGEQSITFNMHLLYHLASHVARWGPLWASSAYCYESFNGFMKNIIHSQQGVPHQVVRAFSWDYSLKVLYPKVSEKARSFVRSLTSKSPRGTSIGSCVLYGSALLFHPTEEERLLCDQIECDVDACEMYPKLMQHGCMFSVPNIRSSTNNSIAQLVDKRIVLIHKILYDRNTVKVVLLVSVIHTETVLTVPEGVVLDNADHLMQRVTFIEEEKECVFPENLQIVCFSATFEHGHFIAPLPHVYVL